MKNVIVLQKDEVPFDKLISPDFICFSTKHSMTNSDDRNYMILITLSHGNGKEIRPEVGFINIRCASSRPIYRGTRFKDVIQEVINDGYDVYSFESFEEMVKNIHNKTF